MFYFWTVAEMQGTGRRRCVSGCTLLFSHVSLYFWPMFNSGSMSWGRLACLPTLQADTSMGHSRTPGTRVLAASLCLCCQCFPAPAALALAQCTSWRRRTLTDPRAWKFPAGSLRHGKGQHWNSQAMQLTCQKGAHSPLPLVLPEDRNCKAGLSILIGEWHRLI